MDGSHYYIYKLTIKNKYLLLFFIVNSFFSPSDCKMKNLGTDYAGTKSETKSGIPCQRWDMQYPHEHSQTDARRFPDATVSDASNFCRNPNQNPTGPWCFTIDPDLKWEVCDIPLCSGRWQYCVEI